MALSETFIRADRPSEDFTVPGFKTWQTNRSGDDKWGGGLLMMYKEGLTAHQFNPMVPPDLTYVSKERQWLLLSKGPQKLAFLHTYLACQNNQNNNNIVWNEDLYSLLIQECILLKNQGFVVLALGDFNARLGEIRGLEGNNPDRNSNAPLFMDFVKQTQLLIINTLPVAKGFFTRFMNASGLPGTRSVLDYGLIDNQAAHSVQSFVIDEDARFAAGSDHALLEVVVSYSLGHKVKWNMEETLQYHLDDPKKLKEYGKTLESMVSSLSISEFESLSTEQMLLHLTTTIHKASKEKLGLKTKKRVRKGRRLPREIIKLICYKSKLSLSTKGLAGKRLRQVEDKLEREKMRIGEMIGSWKLRKRSCLR